MMSRRILRWVMGEVGLLRERAQSLRLAYSCAQKVVADFARFNVARSSFWWATIQSGTGRILSIVQLGLLYRAVHSIIEGDHRLLFGSTVQRWLHPLGLYPENSALASWIGVLMLAIAIKGLEIYLNYRAERFLYESAKQAQASLNSEIFNRALRDSYSYVDMVWAEKEGGWNDVVRILTERTHKYSMQLRSSFHFFMSFWTLAVVLTLLLVMSPRLFALGLVTIVVSRYLCSKMLSALGQSLDLERDHKRRADRSVSSVIGALLLVKSMGMEEREIEKFREHNQDFLEEANEANTLRLLDAPLNEASKTLSTALMSVILLVYRSLSSTVHLPGAVVGLVLIRQVESALQKTFGSMRNLSEYESLKSEIESLGAEDDKRYKLACGSEKMSEFKEAIELRDLSFGYEPESAPALDKINLKLARGKVLGVVGATGSGKSSLIKVLLRLYNVGAGQYRIDGKDVNSLEIGSIRDLFSVVTQDSVWLQESLRDNLLYGLKESVSDDRIQELCQQLNVWDAICRSRRKLNTVMYARGGSFSGGELQCLSLVRALLRDSPIVLLDESTSALDATTETRVQSAIAQLSKSKTLVIVAHRLSALTSVDEVIVLERGKIVEQGSIPQLIEREGAFYELWRQQGSLWLGDRAQRPRSSKAA